MFKFINALGKLVVKLYFIEAKKLDKKAKADSQRAIELAKQSREKSDAAVSGIHKSAAIAAKAQSISKFFE